MEQEADEKAKEIIDSTKNNIMTQNYIEENKKRFLEELMDLLTIPSASADLSFKKDVLKAAQFLSKN